jgi:hypothetical protein
VGHFPWHCEPLLTAGGQRKFTNPDLALGERYNYRVRQHAELSDWLYGHHAWLVAALVRRVRSVTPRAATIE